MSHITLDSILATEKEAILDMMPDLLERKKLITKYPVLMKAQIFNGKTTIYRIQYWTKAEIIDGFIIKDNLLYELSYIHRATFVFDFGIIDGVKNLIKIENDYTFTEGKLAACIMSRTKDKAFVFNFTFIQRVNYIRTFSKIIPQVFIN